MLFLESDKLSIPIIFNVTTSIFSVCLICRVKSPKKTKKNKKNNNILNNVFYLKTPFQSGLTFDISIKIRSFFFSFELTTKKSKKFLTVLLNITTPFLPSVSLNRSSTLFANSKIQRDIMDNFHWLKNDF